MVDHLPSRRSFLSVIAAAGVTAGATIPVISMPGADAELVSLGARHASLSKETANAFEHQCKCEDVAVSLLPPEPQAIMATAGDYELFECTWRGRRFEDRESTAYLPEEIEALRKRPQRRRTYVPFDPATGHTWPEGEAPAHIWEVLEKFVRWPEAQARADEIISAYDKYKKECDEVDERTGFAEAQRTLDRLQAERDVIRKAIISMPAKSMVGVGVKARLAEVYR